MTVYGPRAYRRERLIAHVGDHEVIVLRNTACSCSADPGRYGPNRLYRNEIPRHDIRKASASELIREPSALYLNGIQLLTAKRLRTFPT